MACKVTTLAAANHRHKVKKGGSAPLWGILFPNATCIRTRMIREDLEREHLTSDEAAELLARRRLEGLCADPHPADASQA